MFASANIKLALKHGFHAVQIAGRGLEAKCPFGIKHRESNGIMTWVSSDLRVKFVTHYPSLIANSKRNLPIKVSFMSTSHRHWGLQKRNAYEYLNSVMKAKFSGETAPSLLPLIEDHAAAT